MNGDPTPPLSSNPIDQIRSCLEWRDGPLAPDRRVQVRAGQSEQFWEALRLLFNEPPSETGGYQDAFYAIGELIGLTAHANQS